MCGIAGFFDTSGFENSFGIETASRMSATLRHRGPDDAGVWVDATAGVALAHRRLSILDLSAAGHQPMSSPCGRYVLTYNGEIYNHLEIRKRLEGLGANRLWRGHSDTETLLAAITDWGIEKALQHAVGMFALALWDRSRRVLTLARDRLGEKPLYYGWLGSSFVFGSELKALRAHPKFCAQVDRDSVALYLRHNYVPAPWSIFSGVWKLPAGSHLSIDAGSERSRGNPEVYWSARTIAIDGIGNAFRGSEKEAEEELERLLRQSIAGQMVADVPVAAFLSGGIDSSSIVALMQSMSPHPIKTFSIGFHEQSYNEAEHARSVANHLKTDHVELYVTPREALDVVPRLPDLYDEPFADSSQVPTFLMTSLTRQYVTVALSGDGGDELFGGYNRYFWAMEAWRRISAVPRILKHVPAALLRSVSPARWDRLARVCNPAIPKRLRFNSPGDKLHKLAAILEATDPLQVYQQLISHWSSPTDLVRGARDQTTAVTDPEMWLNPASFAEQMMFLDLVTYMADDILVKVDRAAMGASLETRVPFLDHRVVEFAWRLPLDLKIRSGEGKFLLRRLLYRFVPRELVERPKMGFGIPIDIWLRGPLRDWAESLLAENRLRDEGFFDWVPVRRRWQEHLSGRSNWQYHLWDILMFQAWLERLSESPLASCETVHEDFAIETELAGQVSGYAPRGS